MSRLPVLCSSVAEANRPPTKAPARASTTKRAPATTAPRTQEVSGDLREAMLHLRRVHFGLDSDTLRPEAREALAEAAERLRAYPGVEVYVEGPREIG